MQSAPLDPGVSPWLVGFAALAYALVMFLVAWRAQETEESEEKLRPHWPIIYALSLGVYFTSWTYFGAVGAAASQGWSFVPIYLGPALMFLFGMPFLERLAAAVIAARSLSISDFISTRFGRSRPLAALVAGLAVCGAVPYVALQLKALGMSFAELVRGGPGGEGESLADSAVLIATAALAVFTIAFGARRYEASGRNRGLVIAMAMDSAVKLAALLLVAVLAISLLGKADAGALFAAEQRLASRFDPASINVSLVTITLLSLAAIVCLPRQFYIMFVELRAPDHLRRARWPFLAYLALTTVVVLPITLAGFTVLPPTAAPDMFVLDLPLWNNSPALALFVFIGGLAASAGMVVVASLALSTMIANDLVAPMLLRNAQIVRGAEIGRLLLFVRRAAIVLVLMLAYGYYLAVDRGEALASIGLVAFAAMVQFAPALLGAVYGFGWTEKAVRYGLAAGAALWAYTLLLPAYLGDAGVAALGLNAMFGGALNPHALAHVPLGDPLTHGVVWSLGVNLLVVVAASARQRGLASGARPLFRPARVGQARTVGDLMELARRFVGPAATREAFAQAFAAKGQPLRLEAPLDRASARTAEQLVAQVIGASSARVIVGSALSGASLDVRRVVNILDETSQELQFSREILAATLKHISQGVSVVDKDLRLVAWNTRYLEMFEFPEDFIKVGRPIADVIRFNAERGECGPGEVDEHVARRLEHMRVGAAHTFERARPNGAVLQTIGGPMPGGGYVTTFTDITQERETQIALARANEGLEERVRLRTAELQHEAALNRTLAQELNAAKQAADAANASKTRFLAAASHDLLQPLHAARLFNQALSEGLAQTDPQGARLAESTDRAIASADKLLRALLDVSKLEAGGIKPQPTTFPISSLIEELMLETAPVAKEKNLRLVAREPCDCGVYTDRTLLRQVLQNLLANALRYTTKGGVLIGCRWRRNCVRIEVWDTGPGIPANRLEAIFTEFACFDQPGQRERGTGLGLSIARRSARLLGADLTVASRPGRGSMFALDIPRAAGACVTTAESLEADSAGAPTQGLRVLCLENEAPVLAGVLALMKAWGCITTGVATYDASLAAAGPFDAAMLDLHLDGAETGLDVAASLRARGFSGPIALITADPKAAAGDRVVQLGVTVLAKPVDPSLLRALIARDRTITQQSTHVDKGA